MSFDPEAPAAEASGVFGLTTTPEESALVLIPVPFDATTSYGRRTRLGPRAILDASHQVDLFDLETGRPYELGIAMLEPAPQIEQWNAEATSWVDQARDATSDTARREACANADRLGEQLNRWLYDETRAWLARGKLVGLVGGDHSTPYGHLRAHLERYPALGVLHIDAHADLRQAYEGFAWSHASIMWNVTQRLPLTRLVQVGVRDFAESELELIRGSDGRIRTFFDLDVAKRRFAGKTLELIDEIVEALPSEVYVSFDIDGLDPGLCPHTGTPVPGGLAFNEACAILAAVRASGRRIVGFDLNEVAPGPDGDEWDGNVGARLLYKLCGQTIAGVNRGHLRRV